MIRSPPPVAAIRATSAPSAPKSYVAVNVSPVTLRLDS